MRIYVEREYIVKQKYHTRWAFIILVLSLAAALLVGCAGPSAPSSATVATPETAPLAGATSALPPEPTPAATASPVAPGFQRVEAVEPAAPGVDIYNPALPHTPDWLGIISDRTYGHYRNENTHAAGFSVPVSNGQVDFYTTKDDGVSWQQRTADFGATFEGAPFTVSAFQMVSDTTGFVVLAQRTEDNLTSPMYDSALPVAIYRTGDGGTNWQLMGIQTPPANAEHDSWHTQGFLWINEKVGLWVPHTRYDTFCVWRTVDGGANWEELDISSLFTTAELQKLRYAGADETGSGYHAATKTEMWDDSGPLPFDEVAGVHTCTLHITAPHTVAINCYALRSYGPRNGSSSGTHFMLVTPDDGATWQLETWAGANSTAVPADGE